MKLLGLSLLARVLRFPFMRGRVTISEFAYRLLSPRETMVSFLVGGRSVYADLSQQELRYVYFGAFERSECEFLTRFLRQGDVAVDVGANYGYLSAIMLDCVGPRGAVYAFEPNPYVYRYLDHLRTTSDGTFHPYQLAVGSYTSEDEKEKVSFLIDKEHSMWSSVVDDGGVDRPGDMLKVGVVSLSDFFQRHAIEKIDLIKIDVEGGEAAVLRGLLAYLHASHRPTILCEIAPTASNSWSETIELINKLADLDYAVFRIAPNGSLEEFSRDRLVSETKTQNVVFGIKAEVSKRI